MKEIKQQTPKPPVTAYGRAWLKFLTTSEYLKAAKAMADKGMQQPYIDNILRCAFEWGWNLSTTPEP